jgi:hypothetical protein
MSVKIGYEPLENWLSEYTNPTTRYQNRKFFDVYLQWTGKTPKELIDSFDQIKTKSQILQFQNYLLNDYVTPRTKKMMPNSARSHLTSVRAFYASQKEPIRGLKNKIIDVEAAKNEHTFSIEDLRSMFAVANLRDKALIATSTSLGWEISAIQALEKDFIEKLVQRAKSQNIEFISFDWQRKKTGAAQFGILNSMALFSLEQYLAKLNKENPTQTKLFDLSVVGLNNILKKLADDANLVLIGKIHFHLLRKFLMNALSDAGLNSFEIKLILGKKIGISDQTYLQTLKKSSFEKYRKCYPSHLSLTMNVNGNAKYNILTDLVTQHIKSQQALIEYMKTQGMLEHVPQPIQDQLNSVYEFAKIMEKSNGDKPKPKEGEEHD